MNIDDRIARIMAKMEGLSTKHPKFHCGKFPPEWEAPIAEEQVVSFEKENGIKLPPDYRRFITTTASAGTQPFYGLFGLGTTHRDALCGKVNEKFLYTVRRPLSIAALSDEEYDAIYESDAIAVNAGCIPLCHEGCAMYSILIVNTDDEETYGTVWYYDLANDAGIYPLLHPITHKTMGFLDWLEYYVDKTMELDDSDYFSYSELTGIVE